jgi:hypothetical protein
LEVAAFFPFSVDTEDAVSGGFLIAVLFAAAAATLVTTVWRIFFACPKRLFMVMIEGERSDSAIGQNDSFCERFFVIWSKPDDLPLGILKLVLAWKLHHSPLFLLFRLLFKNTNSPS